MKYFFLDLKALNDSRVIQLKLISVEGDLKFQTIHVHNGWIADNTNEAVEKYEFDWTTQVRKRIYVKENYSSSKRARWNGHIPGWCEYLVKHPLLIGDKLDVSPDGVVSHCTTRGTKFKSCIVHATSNYYYVCEGMCGQDGFEIHSFYKVLKNRPNTLNRIKKRFKIIFTTNCNNHGFYSLNTVVSSNESSNNIKILQTAAPIHINGHDLTETEFEAFCLAIKEPLNIIFMLHFLSGVPLGILIRKTTPQNIAVEFLKFTQTMNEHSTLIPTLNIQDKVPIKANPYGTNPAKPGYVNFGDVPLVCVDFDSFYPSLYLYCFGMDYSQGHSILSSVIATLLKLKRSLPKGPTRTAVKLLLNAGCYGLLNSQAIKWSTLIPKSPSTLKTIITKGKVIMEKFVSHVNGKGVTDIFMGTTDSLFIKYNLNDLVEFSKEFETLFIGRPFKLNVDYVIDSGYFHSRNNYLAVLNSNKQNKQPTYVCKGVFNTLRVPPNILKNLKGWVFAQCKQSWIEWLFLNHKKEIKVSDYAVVDTNKFNDTKYIGIQLKSKKYLCPLSSGIQPHEVDVGKTIAVAMKLLKSYILLK